MQTLYVIFASSLLLWSNFAFSEEPKLDINHPIANDFWYWRINSKDTEQLILISKGKKVPEIKFDISGCMFCEGEEDGCEQDGIFDLSKQLNTTEPLVILVCHIGAHSRLLEIYAPERDSQNPVFQQTGDYVIDYSVNSNGVEVSFDRRDDNGEFQQLTKLWPLKTSKDKRKN